MFVLKSRYKDLKLMYDNEASKNKLLIDGRTRQEKYINELIDNLKELKNKNVILEHENEGLHTRTTVDALKIEEYQGRIKELEKDNEDLKEGNVKLGQLFNRANNDLWCNEESKRQLRKLADEILECDDYKKQKVWKYLHDIADRMGGGRPIEFVAKDNNVEDLTNLEGEAKDEE